MMKCLGVVCWFFCVLSLLCCFSGVFFAFFFIFALFFGAMAYVLTHQKSTNPKKASATVPDKTENTPIDESKKNYVLFEDVENDSVLYYECEENLCLSDDFTASDFSCRGGEFVDFVQEPDNEYDSKAVAIHLGGRKIGYIYKGNVQDMANDWIRRGDHFLGYINKIFAESNKITYKIGFYKPLEQFENKIFSLVKTSKKIDDVLRREDNLYSITEGDTVIIDFDKYLESYVVFNEHYEEIGEIGNSIFNFVEEKQCKKLVGKVSEFSYDDNDKPKIKITVYLIR